MGQRSNDAAVKDAQTKSSREECARGMGHTIIPMMNLLHSDIRTDLHMMKRLQLSPIDVLLQYQGVKVIQAAILLR